MAIKVEAIDKELSANAGLFFYNELFEQTKLGHHFADAMPALKAGVARSVRKAKQIILGLVAGADCLDDHDRLAKDKGFEAVCSGSVYSSKSCGDFLRNFTPLQIRSLNQKLGESAFAEREATYRGRCNAENYIKDVKLGLDMQHYPCQKLVANRAYGVLGAFAYNMMRFFAVSENKKSPKQAKAVRFYFVHLPCQVVCHAGEVIFRFMKKQIEEVRYWLDRIAKLQSWFY